MKIALIDDNFDVRVTFKLFLEEHGYTVYVYDCPNKLMECEERFDAYVFDWNFHDKCLNEYKLSIPREKIVLISGTGSDPSKGKYKFVNKTRADDLLIALEEIRQYRSFFQIVGAIVFVSPSLGYLELCMALGIR